MSNERKPTHTGTFAPPPQPQGQEPEQKPLPAAESSKYTEYEEYKLEVKTIMKRIQGIPGEFFDRYEMTIQQKVRDHIRVEAHRAKRLNTKMHDRKVVLIETGTKVPVKIIRTLTEGGNTELNGGYTDKHIS